MLDFLAWKPLVGMRGLPSLIPSFTPTVLTCKGLLSYIIVATTNTQKEN